MGLVGDGEEVSIGNAGGAVVCVVRVQDVPFDMFEFGRVTWEARATLEGSTHLAQTSQIIHPTSNVPSERQLGHTCSSLPHHPTYQRSPPHHPSYHTIQPTMTPCASIPA
jgi:hypothetical protein